MVKEPEEIRILEEAFRMAQGAFRRFQEQVKPGMTEIEAAALLEFELRISGSDGLSFETIVASGPHSALPHARPRQAQIPGQEILLVDFGLKYRGYCSDLTRIHFWPDAPRPGFYDLVKEAQEAAIEATRPGASSRAVDSAARNLISGRGYGQNFGHGTGHGLGLEIHELPRISPHSDTPLLEGMVFTIEPGIYLPGECGVRIEDVVVVTSDGCRHLSDPTV
jgi:Xaa-Pro aminopeptidase